ncbi:hypothetical protein BON22_0937 [Cyberlindnera fabianii]|uniref:Uncharacterized protein n=1 Tax=Cyberlindnera fabianii TaxID=36022 RepID=A0A1V2L9T4_CYBFA|nr:hypothetical protein BON22_0937 [Cyberlindnera fabianii]
MNNENQLGATNPNQSSEYESWVNSLGSIQDGLFQNTPMTSHILQHSPFNLSQQQGSNGSSAVLGQQSLQSQLQDVDLYCNSPERFYREIINESPILSRTPQVGRTPLRNLQNMNFSTPLILKGTDAFFYGSATKAQTPLKHLQFNSNQIFQTPHDEDKENSNDRNTQLNSSPTTIKMGSSAVKPEEQQNTMKIIPPSPTPGSKIPSTDFSKKNNGSNNNSNNNNGNNSTAPVPKMGCFKKTPEPETKTTSWPTTNSNFQIIMTDVNSFANNTKPKRKKRLQRSSTVTSTTGKTITKKSSLKRTLSQPPTKLEKAISTPLSHCDTSDASIGSTPLQSQKQQPITFPQQQTSSSSSQQQYQSDSSQYSQPGSVQMGNLTPQAAPPPTQSFQQQQQQQPQLSPQITNPLGQTPQQMLFLQQSQSPYNPLRSIVPQQQQPHQKEIQKQTTRPVQNGSAHGGQVNVENVYDDNVLADSDNILNSYY